MTNDLTIEQAVGELKAMKEHIEPHMSVVGVTAYDMAIQALEAQPCEDCISREEVQDLISRWLSDYLLDETREALETINYKVGDMPSVTPERPKGKWIETPVENDIVPVVFKCSECGMRVVNPYKYCPNCGAEMSGGGEDEVNN